MQVVQPQVCLICCHRTLVQEKGGGLYLGRTRHCRGTQVLVPSAKRLLAAGDVAPDRAVLGSFDA